MAPLLTAWTSQVFRERRRRLLQHVPQVGQIALQPIASTDTGWAGCNVAIDDARISATSSGMNAVMLVTQALVGRGDNVVCVTPSWPNILRAISILGGEVREMPLAHDERGWSLDLQKLSGLVIAAYEDVLRMPI